MAKPVKPKKKMTINPLTGKFDLVSDNNFSYEQIPNNKKLLIPDNHQMAVYDEFIIEGELVLEGALIMED